mmetsp:Transcript_39283/g.100356  ORF Transcript_39283/g.100356 Transcript_39283/m.100356 type:complete len:237 (+) Transcript_39283:115-825(+)
MGGASLTYHLRQCSLQLASPVSSLVAPHTFQYMIPNRATTSAEYTNANDFQMKGSVTFSAGMSRNRILSASFSFGWHSLARSAGTVNMKMLHIPIRRAMSGSSDGNSTLNDSSPPTTTASHAWTSNTWYSRLPGTAGFFFAAPDGLGAMVFAILFSSFATCGVAAFLEAFVVATGPSPSPAPSWARVRTTLVHRPGINLRDAFTCGEAVARRADTAGLGPASAKQRRVATRAMLAN